jgi:hypothetical protein
MTFTRSALHIMGSAGVTLLVGTHNNGHTITSVGSDSITHYQQEWHYHNYTISEHTHEYAVSTTPEEHSAQE